MFIYQSFLHSDCARVVAFWEWSIPFANWVNTLRYFGPVFIRSRNWSVRQSEWRFLNHWLVDQILFRPSRITAGWNFHCVCSKIILDFQSLSVFSCASSLRVANQHQLLKVWRKCLMWCEFPNCTIEAIFFIPSSFSDSTCLSHMAWKCLSKNFLHIFAPKSFAFFQKHFHPFRTKSPFSFRQCSRYSTIVSLVLILWQRSHRRSCCFDIDHILLCGSLNFGPILLHITSAERLGVLHFSDDEPFQKRNAQSRPSDRDVYMMVMMLAMVMRHHCCRLRLRAAPFLRWSQGMLKSLWFGRLWKLCDSYWCTKMVIDSFLLILASGHKTEAH